MAISLKEIRTERQWRASTGLNEEQFKKLVDLFGSAYEELFGESIQDRQSNSTSTSTFQSYEDLLFFGLYSIKCGRHSDGLTYDLLALSFDLAPSNAFQIQALSLQVLQSALAVGGYLPKREYATEEEFKKHWQKEADIMVDATEQPRQRPGNQYQ